MKYIVDIFLIIGFLLIIWLKRKDKISEKVASILKIIIISLFIEFTIFNIKSYRFLFDFDKKEATYTQDQIEINSDKTDYSLKNLEKVKTIYIETNGNDKIEYNIKYTDAAVSNNYLSPKKYIEELEPSKYTAVSFCGEIKELHIIFDEQTNINKIVINKTIPISVNILRVCIIAFVLFTIYSLKNHKFWDESYSEKSIVQGEIMLGILVFSILLCSMFCLYNGNNKNDFYTKDFVKSLSNFQISLEQKPSEELLNLDNPYDYSQRESLKGSTEETYGRPYMYDVALFGGEYYVYFGVLPAILLFLPFYAITGKYLLAAYGVFIFAALAMIVAVLLIKRIYLKWFKKLPFKLLVAAEIVLLFGIGIFPTITSPRFYEVITISGLFFAMMGLYFIIGINSKTKSKKMKLFVGCLSLALAVACRPTQIFTSLIAIPFFISLLKEANQIDKTKNNSKAKHKELVDTLANILVPYMFIGVILMEYNYARFGNPFDFGEKYQLTLYNANETKLNIFSLFQGVVTALFNLPLFKMDFPFVTSHQYSLPVYAHLYVEDISAGLFFLSPICFILFTLKRFIKQCKEEEKESKANKEILVFVISLLVVAGIILLYTVAKAGITIRYFLDFAWLLVIASIIIFFKNYESKKSAESKKILETIIITIAVITFIYNFLQGFNGDAYGRGMQNVNPAMFERIKNMFIFWQ